MLKGTTGLAVGMCGLMLLASLDVSASRFYKSVDENGNIVFSDRPDGASAEQIDVKVFTPDVPVPPVPGAKRTDEDAKKSDQAESAQQDVKALQATRAENCKKAKAHLHKLQTISRLYTEDDKGVRTYVSDEERVKQLAKAHESISEWCQ